MSSSSSSIGVGGGAAGVNRQQRSTGANLLEFAAAIMRGGGNANSSGSAGSVRSSGSGGAGGAVGPVAQSRAWGLRGAGAGGGGGVGGWAERRNLIPGARGVQASSGSSVSGGRGEAGCLDFVVVHFFSSSSMYFLSRQARLRLQSVMRSLSGTAAEYQTLTTVKKLGNLCRADSSTTLSMGQHMKFFESD